MYKSQHGCNRLIDQPWPAADLEAVHACPACGSLLKTKAFAEVKDWAFQAAPGSWDFWRCGNCQSLYLDPRPTAKSIGRAYQHYYTHANLVTPAVEAAQNAFAASKAFPPATFTNRLRQECFYHWLGMESNTRLHWPSRWARLALGALKPFVARQFPLDQLASQPRGRLLDVGCGNGALMAAAQAMGFRVAGIEIDALAVQAARIRNLDVRQGSFENLKVMQEFAGETELFTGFDYVICSHVLEHVHTPHALLAWLIQAVKPGGQIFLVWPNPRSLTLRIFGRYWRGLEAPRHLCLMSFEAAVAALAMQNIGHCERLNQGIQTVGESLRLRRVGKRRSLWSDFFLDKLARSLSPVLGRWFHQDFVALRFKKPLPDKQNSHVN